MSFEIALFAAIRRRQVVFHGGIGCLLNLCTMNSLFSFIAFTLYADHDSLDFCSKLFFFAGAAEGISKSVAGRLDATVGCDSVSLEDRSRFLLVLSSSIPAKGSSTSFDCVVDSVEEGLLSTSFVSFSFALSAATSCIED